MVVLVQTPFVVLTAVSIETSPILTVCSLYLKGQISHTKVLIENDGRILALLLCFRKFLY